MGTGACHSAEHASAFPARLYKKIFVTVRSAADWNAPLCGPTAEDHAQYHERGERKGGYF
jgi:hypothetical protein